MDTDGFVYKLLNSKIIISQADIPLPSLYAEMTIKHQATEISMNEEESVFIATNIICVDDSFVEDHPTVILYNCKENLADLIARENALKIPKRADVQKSNWNNFLSGLHEKRSIAVKKKSNQVFFEDSVDKAVPLISLPTNADLDDSSTANQGQDNVDMEDDKDDIELSSSSANSMVNHSDTHKSILPSSTASNASLLGNSPPQDAKYHRSCPSEAGSPPVLLEVPFFSQPDNIVTRNLYFAGELANALAEENAPVSSNPPSPAKISFAQAVMSTPTPALTTNQVEDTSLLNRLSSVKMIPSSLDKISDKSINTKNTPKVDKDSHQLINSNTTKPKSNKKPKSTPKALSAKKLRSKKNF